MDSPRIVRIDPCRPDPLALDDAASVLKNGGLVVVPTETVYGLAADPQSGGGLEKLYRVKARPPGKPIARFISGIRQAEDGGGQPGRAGRLLAERFWPGPLTLVMPYGTEVVGFRVPDHPVALGLLERVDEPLAVTSANRSGKADALTADQAVQALGADVDLVMDAGPSPGMVPSTVVKVMGDSIEVLREGALEKDLIAGILEEIL